MDKKCSSLQKVAETMVNFIQNNINGTQFDTKMLSEQFNLDQRRVSDVIAVLCAIRWIKRDAKKFIVPPKKQQQFEFDCLNNELKTKQYVLDVKTDNELLCMAMLQQYQYTSFNTHEMAEHFNNMLLYRRINDINCILHVCGLITLNKNKYQMNQNISFEKCEDQQKQTAKTENERISRIKVFSQETRDQPTPHSQQCMEVLSQIILNRFQQSQE